MARAEKPRFLFVGADSGWQDLATQAAARFGASIDIEPNVAEAVAGMLRTGRLFDHVLAMRPIGSGEIDALAGMLDEVTRRPTPLLLMGCANSMTAAPHPCVMEASVEAVVGGIGRAQPMRRTPPIAANRLADALHSGSLRMRYQPILMLDGLLPVGLESLARLHQGAEGILHPQDFIPLVRGAGREQVLTSIAAARTFLDIGTALHTSGLFVTLNLPLDSVLYSGSVERGLELCRVAGITPGEIIIEVLETREAPDLPRLRQALRGWQAAGFRVAIDDAGPALPHWQELLTLPFDALKLDGTMVADPAQHGLLTEIVAAARQQGCFIVAEGIEDEACLNRVRALQVDAVQGFLFARPLPALAVPIWRRYWQAQSRAI